MMFLGIKCSSILRGFLEKFFGTGPLETKRTWEKQVIWGHSIFSEKKSIILE
jgi:hypothetical protein